MSENVDKLQIKCILGFINANLLSIKIINETRLLLAV